MFIFQKKQPSSNVSKLECQLKSKEKWTSFLTSLEDSAWMRWMPFNWSKTANIQSSFFKIWKQEGWRTDVVGFCSNLHFSKSCQVAFWWHMILPTVIHTVSCNSYSQTNMIMYQKLSKINIAIFVSVSMATWAPWKDMNYVKLGSLNKKCHRKHERDVLRPKQLAKLWVG